ncbi:peptidyl-prolyl cis-trans isomerase [Brevibacillus daliensis]|uniref:peptidyl-prolyl cis-trans isomerase n=1 Tax=Brevibacillus daliensis TaxID=2892995 RepID=UPI001E28A07E|nr:peptidyl-prolyl cis-trans isomerase [Brevibacillus daliensis]
MRNIRLLWYLVGGMTVLLLVMMGAWYEGVGLTQVAQVGSTTITKSELVAEMNGRYGEQTIAQMINKELVFQEAKQNNLIVSDEQIETEFNQVKARLLVNKDSAGVLDPTQLPDDDQIKDDVRYQLLLKKIATNGVKISDEEMKSYFHKHEEDYYQPGQVHLFRIVVQTEEEALELKVKIDNGADFSEMAKNRSRDDATASRGGEIGLVPVTSDFFDEQERTMLKGLEINKVSSPVPVEKGYAIFKVSTRTKAVQPIFDEAKEQVFQDMAVAKAESFDEILNRLRKAANLGGKS